MINKTIVIGALARDCANSILRNKEKIEELRSHFKKSYVVIIENDSKDKTKQVLDEYSKQAEYVTILSKDYKGNYPFKYSGIPLVKGMSCQRIARMAFIRNKLLDYIRSNYKSDYTMFLDIDVCDFSVEGIIHSIQIAPKDWGALFANGRSWMERGNLQKPMPILYDSYAIVPFGEDVYSTTLVSTKPICQLLRGISAYNNLIKSHFASVYSAFGGIGIYKSSLLNESQYDLIIPKGWEQYNITLCEHIPLNLSIINQGYKCYISDMMDVRYHMFNTQKKTVEGFMLWNFPRLSMIFIKLIKR